MNNYQITSGSELSIEVQAPTRADALRLVLGDRYISEYVHEIFDSEVFSMFEFWNRDAQEFVVYCVYPKGDFQYGRYPTI